MLLGDVLEVRGEADAAGDDLQEALACSSLLAPLMPALAKLIVDAPDTSQTTLCECLPGHCAKGNQPGQAASFTTALLISPEFGSAAGCCAAMEIAAHRTSDQVSWSVPGRSLD